MNKSDTDPFTVCQSYQDAIGVLVDCRGNGIMEVIRFIVWVVVAQPLQRCMAQHCTVWHGATAALHCAALHGMARIMTLITRLEGWPGR